MSWGAGEDKEELGVLGTQAGMGKGDWQAGKKQGTGD